MFTSLHTDRTESAVKTGQQKIGKWFKNVKSRFLPVSWKTFWLWALPPCPCLHWTWRSSQTLTLMRGKVSEIKIADLSRQEKLLSFVFWTATVEIKVSDTNRMESSEFIGAFCGCFVQCHWIFWNSVLNAEGKSCTSGMGLRAAPGLREDKWRRWKQKVVEERGKEIGKS